jgi:5,10-methylenetetrahydrofolate reductase
MVYGPCGGVRADLTCELGDRRCVFVDEPLVRWAGPASTPDPDPVARPFVVTDLRVAPYDLASIESVTRTLAAACDAVLVGEHPARPDFPPAMMATAVAAAGGAAWITLTCRDRNRVVLESELQALAAIGRSGGVAGVHCVTGDARDRSVRPDATQVFDLDSLELTAMARALRLTVSVAATPAAPPAALRPARIVEKQRAGASLCFVNHAGGPGPVASFVAAARAAGATLRFVPCVAVFTDAESLAVLERFPGLVLDPAERRRVMDSPDSRQEGVAAAVDQAERMLAIDGVVGVNLSGSACGGAEAESAAIMADVAAGIRASVGG